MPLVLKKMPAHEELELETHFMKELTCLLIINFT